MKTNSLKAVRISSKQLLFIVLFLETLAITIAISLAISANKSTSHYFGEGTFITYFSCFQLLVVTVLSWMIFRQEKQSSELQLLKNTGFWLIVSLGGFFLALDEALSIHEQLDKWMHSLLKVEETMVTDLADDFIVGFYLILALIYVASQWQTLKIFRSSFTYFKIGFILGGVMVVLDILSNNYLFVSMVTDDAALMRDMLNGMKILEESAKLIAEGFFLTGVYQCWRQVKSMNSPKVTLPKITPSI